MLFIVSFILGLLFAALGFYIYFKTENRDKRNSLVLVLFVFIAIVIWYIPLEISQEVYSVPEGVLSAILQGVASLTGDSYSKEMVADPTISALFSFAIMAGRIIILVFLFDVVISFVGVPYQYILSWINRKRKTFVFGTVNERTIAIARSVGSKKETRMIFACGKDADNESLEALKDTGALYFTKSIGQVLRNLVRDEISDTVEVFIFGDNDAENIESLSELAEATKNDKYRHIKAYVELNSTSLIIQNSISTRYRHQERLTVNFIRTAENFAYNNLYDNYIIENAVNEKNLKIIRALIIGADDISIGMLKTMLWLLQIPGYKLEVEVISDSEFISGFKYACPEIKDDMDEPGMAAYHVGLHEGIGYRSEEFGRLIKENGAFTFAFVNCGDDVLNYNVAADLYMFRKRAGIDGDCLIQVRNDKVSAISDKDDELWKHTMAVGTDRDLYSYSYLTNAPIEEAAKLVHDKRQLEKGLTDRVPWDEYCRDEYKRRSTYARALSLRYKLYVISQDYRADYSLLKTDREWMMYEHMRWNVYMQTGGYIKSDKKDTVIGKTHTDLVPFGELAESTQIRDAISVDDDIVNSLLKKRWSRGRFVSKECNKFRIADAGEFVRFFSESHDELIGAKHCFVDSHTENELYGTTRIMFLDENDTPEAYVSVNCKNGNIGSVMKDKDSSKRGFVADILYTATEYNGSKLDCYDDSKSSLPVCYSMAGFIPVCRIKFDESQVSPNWTKEAGTPDIVFMFFSEPGIEYDRYHQKVVNGEYMTYDQYTYTPYVDEFREWAKEKSFSDDYTFGWYIRDYVQNRWQEKRDLYKGKENEFVKDIIGDRK